MDHATNPLSGVSAEHWFAAMGADSSGNLFHPYGLAVDVENLVDQFLTTLCLAAHMAPKHDYLRLA